jgi:CheY-like chemotaxis protein
MTGLFRIGAANGVRRIGGPTLFPEPTGYLVHGGTKGTSAATQFGKLGNQRGTRGLYQVDPRNLPVSADKPRILIVEDNPLDIYLVEQSLRHHQISAVLEILGDGEAAMQRFERPGDPGIDLVLLDLNLPRYNGLTVLEKLRSCGNWLAVPVIIVTSAGSSTLPVLTQWLGANLFFQKSMDLDKSMELGILIKHALQTP